MHLVNSFMCLINVYAYTIIVKLINNLIVFLFIRFIYFYFQRATLAEKEVNTLKEQLTMNNMPMLISPNNTGSNSPPLPIITQNGIPPPSPSTTPLSDSSMTGTPISNSNSGKLLNNNENCSNLSKKGDSNKDEIEKMEINDDDDSDTEANNKNSENAENEIDASKDKRNCSRKSPTMENSCSENLSNLSLNSSSRMNINNNDSKNSDNNILTTTTNTTKRSSSDKSLIEQLADKDREVSRIFHLYSFAFGLNHEK